jgi:CBS domain containing-hemolysin-like protein
MLIILLSAIGVSVFVSALCSLMEAALYAVPLAYVKNEAKTGSRSGKILDEFRDDIGKPIAAILICNTIAHTAGASVAGWAVGEMFGSDYLVIFSIIFTLVILYFSEILPKLIGVVYCKQVSTLIAIPLKTLVWVTMPLIWVSEGVSRWIKSGENEQSLSLDEILSMTALGTEQGTLDTLEGSVIANVIGLDEVLVRDVLTPRVVVFRLEEQALIGSVEKDIMEWNFSRVPLFSDLDPDHLSSYVTQRDIYRELLKGNRDQPLSSIARNLKTVPELMGVDQLLLQMFEEREQLCAVVDEHGGLAGIITFEDIIEEIVGREIVDEYDSVSDLRTFARLLRLTRHRRKQQPVSDTGKQKAVKKAVAKRLK